MGKTEMKKGELDEDIAKVSQKLDRAAAKSAELKQDWPTCIYTYSLNYNNPCISLSLFEY